MAAPQAQSLPQKPAAAERRNWNFFLGYLLIAPPVLIMVFLIFFPAIPALIETLFFTDPKTGAVSLSLQNYISFFKDPILLTNLWFTLEVTLMTVALLFVIGFPLSIYLRFSKSRIAAAVQVLALFPLFVPGVILSFALIRFLGSHGMLDTMLRLVGFTKFSTPYLHPSGVVIGLVWGN